MGKIGNRVFGVGLACGVSVLSLGASPALAVEEARVAVYDKQRDIQLLSLYFSDEQLVEVTTRAPVAVPRVAESVTIVTADEIDRMNAHTLSEVLSRIPGVLTVFTHMDSGDSARIRLQGLLPHHTLVLVDGVRLNTATGGEAFVNVVPLAIIKRIEIIFGPGSSTWGSSLGGVVNIITKGPANSEKPTGRVAGAYGEGRSRDWRADLAGRNYFLYAGRQESDGHKNDRPFAATSYYGKVNLAMPRDFDCNLSLGYSDPQNKYGDFADWDMGVTDRVRQTFGAASLEAKLAPGLSMFAAVKLYGLDYIQTYKDMAVQGWFGGAKDDFLYDYVWHEDTVSSEARLVYNSDWQSLVVGAEISRGRLDYSNHNGAVWRNYYAGFGLTPPAETIQADRTVSETWGVYINDTLRLGKLTVIPGLRHDRHSISQSFTSPSLGVTYRLGQETVARFTVARGFVYPALADIAGGDPIAGTLANPDLRPEKVVSMQAGFDSRLNQLLRYRLAVFRHDIKDVWDYADPLLRSVNGGRTVRSGAQMDAETATWRNLALGLGYTYVHERNLGIHDDSDFYKDSDFVRNDDLHSVKLALKYNDGRYRAQVFGNYAWWDYWVDSSVPDRQFDAIIWDLALGAKVHQSGMLAIEVFATVHNLTNDAHHWDVDYHNPDRWVEAGMTIWY